MSITLTNLSDDLYDSSRNRLNISALKYGVDFINSFNYNDLKKYEFYNQNIQILNQNKGRGYWLWKPFIILQTLESVSANDIVIYSDCGIEIIKPLTPIINLCYQNESILLFANGNHNNKAWTKRDCFKLMDCDNEEAWENSHCDASFSIFKKCDLSIQFVNDWLNYGKNENIITDKPNILGNNLDGFHEHRWDQSILSLLAYKYKIDLYRMPSQFGNHYKKLNYRVKNEFNCANQFDQSQLGYYSVIPFYNSNYDQLLDHHRSQNPKFLINQLKEEEVLEKNKTKNLFKYFHLFKSSAGAVKRKINNWLIKDKINLRDLKISYSKCGEDLIINYIFKLKGIKNPSYLDIGVQNPNFSNNTKFFYDKKSKGINIVENQILFENFNKNRNNDINIYCIVGNNEDKINFYTIKKSNQITSSSSQKIFLIPSKINIEISHNINARTVNDILDEFTNGYFPDFLNLNFFSGKINSLNSFNFQLSYPKVICINTNDLLADYTLLRNNEFFSFLVKEGYYEYAKTNVSVIMVKKDL